MSILNENAQSGVETVFDQAITDDERIQLGLSRETYFEIFEGDTVSVNTNLAVTAHIRGDLNVCPECIKRLPADKPTKSLKSS